MEVAKHLKRKTYLVRYFSATIFPCIRGEFFAYCCPTAATGLRRTNCPRCFFCRFAGNLEARPAGFEPATGGLEVRREGFAGVRTCSKTPYLSGTLHNSSSQLFVCVLARNCTVTVKVASTANLTNLRIIGGLAGE